jgi:hypothetical protein
VIECIFDTPFSFEDKNCRCGSVSFGGWSRTAKTKVPAKTIGVQKLAAKQRLCFGQKQWNDVASQGITKQQCRIESSGTGHGYQSSDTD